MALYFITILFFWMSSVSACDRCLHQSKATYTTQVSSGACGYGSLALGFNNGLLACGTAPLFKGGAGCGACFKVRCNNPVFCKNEGTIVMLTDLQGDNTTDFVLGRDAFIALANNGLSQDLLNMGTVDIEYKRVPCVFQNQNLALRVEDFSSRPYYLAIKLLYQGGQTEILAIDVAEAGSSNWTPMMRNYGAVWDTNKVPSGPLTFRLLATSGYSGKYIWTSNILPSSWESGVVYDTGVQVTDVAEESCYPCDESTW